MLMQSVYLYTVLYCTSSILVTPSPTPEIHQTKQPPAGALAPWRTAQSGSADRLARQTRGPRRHTASTDTAGGRCAESPPTLVGSLGGIVRPFLGDGISINI